MKLHLEELENVSAPMSSFWEGVLVGLAIGGGIAAGVGVGVVIATST